MGPYLGSEPVLEGGDDPAPIRVILGIGGGEENQVEGEADLMAADLDVPLLQDVEEADLDPLGQVGEFVDGEQAAVGPGDQPVVESQLVGKVPAFGNSDRIDLTDQVSD